MRTTIDRFGRVVVPKAVRERLGLHAGASVELREAAGCLSLCPAEEESPLRTKDGVLVFTGAATGDLEAALDEHRRERLRHLDGTRPR